jgi:chromosome segregation ATPase
MSTIGNKLDILQKKIAQANKELSEINMLEQPLPEFINTTNMLRTNEYLQKANEKKSQLLTAYQEYVNELESLVSNIVQIKGNLNYLRSHLKQRKQTIKKIKRKKVRKKIKKRKIKPKTRGKFRKRRS